MGYYHHTDNGGVSDMNNDTMKFCKECARHGQSVLAMKDSCYCGDCHDLYEVEMNERAAELALSSEEY